MSAAAFPDRYVEARQAIRDAMTAMQGAQAELDHQAYVVASCAVSGLLPTESRVLAFTGAEIAVTVARREVEAAFVAFDELRRDLGYAS